MTFRGIRHRRLWLAVTLLAGIFAFYIITVGLAEATSANIQVGRISWLRSERMLDSLDAYILPASRLARVPGVGWLFKLSESCWRNVTSAPICVTYPKHFEPLSISEAPKDLMNTFRVSYPNVEIVSVAKELSGRKGTQLIFWVIQFKDNGKLREALMGSAQKVDMTYDVQNQSDVTKP